MSAPPLCRSVLGSARELTPGPEIVLLLKSALEREAGLRLALLFGSAAAGHLRPDSDVDVAIWPADPGISLEQELDLQARLSQACGREVDLVRLDRASTLLRWQVARTGVCLRSDPPAEEARFRARAGIEHAELRVVRDPAAERYRRRLAARAAGRTGE